MEEFKFPNNRRSKMIINAVFTVLCIALTIGGYGFYSIGLMSFAVIFWFLTAVMVAMVVLVFLSNIRLFQDRLETKTLIKKTIYFKDVSTIDAADFKIVFKDSTENVLASIPIQNIETVLSEMLNFIRKHNPHIKFGSSFIPENEFRNMLEKAIENDLLDINDELPENGE